MTKRGTLMTYKTIVTDYAPKAKKMADEIEKVQMFTFNVGYEKSRQLDKMHLYFQGRHPEEHRNPLR